MKNKSIYLLSAMIGALFVIGGFPHYEASANGLTLTSPNGGEVIPGGSTCEIEWVAPPEMVSFDLKYSTNNGRAWKPIERGITAASYDWHVPTTKNNKPGCLVKVVGYDDAGRKVGADRSDAPFTILGKIASLEARVAALEEALESLLELAPHVSVHTGTINGVAGPHVILTGINLHVRSGSGRTDDDDNPIGLGNLIVGYNEEPTGLGAGERGGSHHLVTGSKNRFSSFGGLVAGFENTVSSPWASVSGGRWNTASGDYSSVSGGRWHTASGDYSSVSGGLHNEASGDYSSVSGGSVNTAGGYDSSISGGIGNTASGYYSSVSGGTDNTASGERSSISGGGGNTAGGYASSVSGGRANTASGATSSVSGGAHNEASTTDSSISGGYENTASGWLSSVSGGRENEAGGDYSSVSGGRADSVTGEYDWRAGDEYFADE